MKKLILAATSAVFLMTQTVFADNLTDILTALNYFSSTTKGATYTSTVYDTPISSIEQWKSIVKSANENLVDSITLTFTAFDADSYELSEISDYNFSISAKGLTNEKNATITYTFNYSSNYKLMRVSRNASLISKLSVEEKVAYALLSDKCNEIKSTCISDYERELAVHDYIVKNFTYNTGNISTADHTVTGFLKNGTGVCEAYASTFDCMASMLGLETQLVTGNINSTAHIWNAVKLDGEYYHVDTTSDDPSPDIADTARYNYFNITTAEIAVDHLIDAGAPQCTATRYNYFEYNNLIAHNKAELTDIINNALQSGQTSITFRTKGYKIENSDVIKNSFKNKGFTTIAISGEYGREATYFINLK
jgi:transglutaminase/protease-like cytokinesis protein 3